MTIFEFQTKWENELSDADKERYGTNVEDDLLDAVNYIYDDKHVSPDVTFNNRDWSVELNYRNGDMYLGFRFKRKDTDRIVNAYMAVGALSKEKDFNLDADIDQLKQMVGYVSNKNVEALSYNFESDRKG